MASLYSIRSLAITFAVVAGLCQSAAAQTTPLQLEDWYALKSVGEFSVSPDGRTASFVVQEIDRAKDRRAGSLWRIATAGGTPERLTWEGSASRPRYSPDGRFLAFVTTRHLEHLRTPKKVAERGQVWILPLGGGESSPVTALKEGVDSYEWAPDSKRLVVLSRDPREGDEEEGKGEKEDPPPPPIVITRLQHKQDGEGFLDGRRRHVYVVDVEPALSKPGETSEARPLTRGPFDAADPVWSPDGQHIAFSSNRTDDPDTNANTDIWIIAASGGEPRRVTDDPGSDGTPVWSPDGRTLAYVHMPVDPPVYATPRLMVIPATGGIPRDLTGRFDRHVAGRPAWSSDGQSLFIALEDEGKIPLVRLTLAGDRLVVDEGDVGAFEVRGDSLVISKETPTRPAELYVLTGASRGARAAVRLTQISDALLGQRRFNPAENIHFKSADGTPIEGWVIKPPGFNATSKYPLVLRIHGGPVAQYTDAFWFEHQYLASLGYVVLFTNPRGSNGYGEAFCRAIFADWGNLDYQDVMAGVDHVIAQGYVDPEKLGVGGWSYGGILTNYAITKTTRFAAAVSGASETDMFSAFGTDDLQQWWINELGYPWRNLDLYRKLSPIMDVEKVTTPTLLMVGDQDYRVPLPQSEQFYVALKALKRETGLIIYPGQSHGINRPSHQIDRLRRNGLWYDKYLLGKDVNPLYERWKDPAAEKKTTS